MISQEAIADCGFIGVKEYARKWGIAHMTAIRLGMSGKIPYVRRGVFHFVDGSVPPPLHKFLVRGNSKTCSKCRRSLHRNEFGDTHPHCRDCRNHDQRMRCGGVASHLSISHAREIEIYNEIALMPDDIKAMREQSIVELQAHYESLGETGNGEDWPYEEED